MSERQQGGDKSLPGAGFHVLQTIGLLLNSVLKFEAGARRLGIFPLVQKWLQAGVSECGQWSETKVDTPQGAVVSPLLANVYLHYVFDRSRLGARKWQRAMSLDRSTPTRSDARCQTNGNQSSQSV